MRLLLVNRALPVHIAGGLERHFEDLALGLAQRGHAVHLLTAPLPSSHDSGASLQAELIREQHQRLAQANITLHAVPGAPANRYSLRWLRAAPKIIAQLCATQKFDVIHAQEFAAGFWQPNPNLPPLVTTVHGTITSETPLHRDVYPLLPPFPSWARPAARMRYSRRLLFRPAWRALLRHSAALLVDSQYTRGELIYEDPTLAQKIRVVPLGVPWATHPMPTHAAARAAIGWPADEQLTTPQLLTLGRLEWAKGQDLALAALAGLTHLPWHYTIAGEGSARPQLERFIARHNLTSRVTLLGRVDLAHIRNLLAAADLFLWPERTHPAFGLVGIEAHLANSPVLANRRGAIPEVLGPDLSGPASPWLVNEPTPDQFRTKLAPLLQTPKQLSIAREGLREKALARFSYQQMLEQTEAAYLLH